MDTVFRINPELDVPIYQQLVDSISTAIKKGTLQPDQQLPTVQVVSEQLGIARGTIKRAYDELERIGLVKKTQGRGTFVLYQPQNSTSRKERAMSAIDSLLTQLEEMGLSAAEINIFINLKLREREEEEAVVKVALVECNPETLSQMADQLLHIKQVDMHTFLLENVEKYPYMLEKDFDLVVTTAEHAEYLAKCISAGKKVVRVALRLTTPCLAALIKLQPGQKIGIMGYSTRFCDLLTDACHTYAEEVEPMPAQLFGTGEEARAYLAGLDGVLLPEGYEKYCSADTLKILEIFPGMKIPCHYKMDDGSALYLESKIGNLLQKKQG